MFFERRCPCRCGPVLQPIPPTDNRPQIRCLSLLLGKLSRLEKCISNDSTPSGAKSVIVQPEDLEGPVLSKERDDGIDGTTAEGIVAQVDFDKRISGDESIADIL